MSPYIFLFWGAFVFFGAKTREMRVFGIVLMCLAAVAKDILNHL